LAGGLKLILSHSNHAGKIGEFASIQQILRRQSFQKVKQKPRFKRIIGAVENHSRSADIFPANPFKQFAHGLYFIESINAYELGQN
jgi:hypothetical protein